MKYIEPYRRVIPLLLYQGEGLVKTSRFKAPKYIGDPINAVKIFNEKRVDELVFLDLNVSESRSKLNLQLIEEIAGECFMPLSYGGGVSSVEDVVALNRIGVEKAIINTAGVLEEGFAKEASAKCGSSSIVASLDYKRDLFGKVRVYVKRGTVKTSWSPVDLALKFQEDGVGELMVNSIDREGSMLGYDLDMIRKLATSVNIPIVLAGGAGNRQHLLEGFQAGASAVAAGSLFVFQGPHKAVLISYLNQEQLIHSII
jgi:cyclase